MAVQSGIAYNSSADKQWGKVCCNFQLCLPSFLKGIRITQFGLSLCLILPCSQGQTAKI